MIASVVDLSKLLYVTLTALAAGVGVSTLFALAVLGATRLGESRSRLRMVGYGAMAIGGILGFATAIVYGVVLLTE